MKERKKKRVLVADDDVAILDAIALILQDEGYHVETTADGETIAKMLRTKPDLLLLDIWMSGHDGREICLQVKNIKETKDIPVVIVSANRDIEKIAREAGADDFLPKPFDIDNLLDKVRKFTI